MRITAELFVAQLTRRVFADGGFATVERRGAEAAGAIFVVLRQRNGSMQLYAPAAQAMADEAGERRFMAEPQQDAEAMAARFAKEARFDPDFWIVELETDDVARYLTLVEES